MSDSERKDSGQRQQAPKPIPGLLTEQQDPRRKPRKPAEPIPGQQAPKKKPTKKLPKKPPKKSAESD